MEYRVKLDEFFGPMDLLVHLIRREEVDVRRIPIARILDQYLEHMKTLRVLDLDEAGEFVVLAATLMSIKARLLLPAEEVNIAEELDPGHELVEKLLEYRRMKELSEELLGLRDAASRRLPRPVAERPPEAPAEAESSAAPIEDLSVYDLLEAFTKIMSEIDESAFRERRIVVSDIPVRIYAERIIAKTREAGAVRFQDLIEGRRTRADVVGCFLAVLLLLKQQCLRLLQRDGRGDILLQFLSMPAETSDGGEGTEEFDRS